MISREYSQAWNKDIEPYYPVNNAVNMKKYNLYAEDAKNEKNVLFGGRLAEYKYYDMDKTIESAIKMYNEICKEGN